MKIIALIVNFVFSVSSFAGVLISQDSFKNERDFRKKNSTRVYNGLMNTLANELPLYDDERLKDAVNKIDKLQKAMKKEGHDQARIDDLDQFKAEIERAMTIRQNIEKCELDDEYNINKSDIAAYTTREILGEVAENLGCRNTNNSVYSFPELNSIKEIGTKIARDTMATEVHHGILAQNIPYYFDVLKRYEGKYPSVTELTKRLCSHNSSHCKKLVREELEKRKQNDKHLVAFSDINESGKQEIVYQINDHVTELNSLVNKMRESSEKNPTLFKVGGNDFVINCKDPESDGYKHYMEYSQRVQQLLEVNPGDQTSRIKKELIVTMLYDTIGMPATHESACDPETGVAEITLEKEQHKTVTVDQINKAAKQVEDNAKNVVRNEINDYKGGVLWQSSEDYIGEKAAFAPEEVGKYIAKHPNTVSYVCEGLKDYQWEEKAKGYGSKALAATLLATGVGAGAGMLLLMARGGYALAASVGGSQVASRVAASSINRFAARGSNALLNSKKAIIGFAGVSAVEIGATTYAQMESEDRARALEAKFLAMPDSKVKDQLLKEYNKLRELDFDLKLAIGLGSLDILGLASLKGLSKLEKGISEAEGRELIKLMNEQTAFAQAAVSDPNFDAVQGLRTLLPDHEFKKFIKDTSQLSLQQRKALNDEIVANVNSGNNFMDGLGTALKSFNKSNGGQKGFKKVRVPNGKEMNRRILASISPTKQAELKVRVAKEYGDIIKAKGFDGPEYADDMASIIHLLEKGNFRNKNLSVSEKKDAVAKKLDELMAKFCPAKK